MISIIIPCFNNNDVINDAIESCYGQGIDEKDFEIIVIDDHSDKPIINDLRNKWNVRCIRNKVNIGPAASRNRGIKESKGEFIAFLDADDLMINNRLKKELDYIDNYQVEFVMSAIVEKTISGAEKHIVFKIPTNQEALAVDIFLDKIYSITPTIFFRKSIIEKVGYMDESLRYFEDKDFLLRVVKYCKIGYIREPLLTRRVFERGTSRSADEQGFIGSRAYFLERAIELFPFLEKHTRKFWAIQFRGFGKLSLLANRPRLGLKYFLKSLKFSPNLKALIYVLVILFPPLKLLVQKNN